MEPAMATMGRHPVRIPCGGVTLEGDLTIPPDAGGVAIFAHGSGSSRFSTRNRAVAESLQERRLATLLLDLLTPAEEERDAVTRALRFDITLLAGRLVAAIDWVKAEPAFHGPIGLFGASTGAGAALVAAARRPRSVGAVVSRGGRPDLAGEALRLVLAPTLLIVGGHDEHVVALNRSAMRHLAAPAELAVVPRATHLFEEPGALEQVATLAGDWFAAHLLHEAAR
ncbi:MAG: dienelactone hydrolase family protein [Gemmatimonadetes bacterium]|nr:dienelactone hydrolase family protein [Gemmatimonadota bacterium]